MLPESLRLMIRTERAAEPEHGLHRRVHGVRQRRLQRRQAPRERERPTERDLPVPRPREASAPDDEEEPGVQGALGVLLLRRRRTGQRAARAGRHAHHISQGAQPAGREVEGQFEMQSYSIRICFN